MEEWEKSNIESIKGAPESGSQMEADLKDGGVQRPPLPCNSNVLIIFQGEKNGPMYRLVQILEGCVKMLGFSLTVRRYIGTKLDKDCPICVSILESEASGSREGEVVDLQACELNAYDAVFFGFPMVRRRVSPHYQALLDTLEWSSTVFLRGKVASFFSTALLEGANCSSEMSRAVTALLQVGFVVPPFTEFEGLTPFGTCALYALDESLHQRYVKAIEQQGREMCKFLMRLLPLECLSQVCSKMDRLCKCVKPRGNRRERSLGREKVESGLEKRSGGRRGSVYGRMDAKEFRYLYELQQEARELEEMLGKSWVVRVDALEDSESRNLLEKLYKLRAKSLKKSIKDNKIHRRFRGEDDEESDSHGLHFEGEGDFESSRGESFDEGKGIGGSDSLSDGSDVSRGLSRGSIEKSGYSREGAYSSDWSNWLSSPVLLDFGKRFYEKDHKARILAIRYELHRIRMLLRMLKLKGKSNCLRSRVCDDTKHESGGVVSRDESREKEKESGRKKQEPLNLDWICSESEQSTNSDREEDKSRVESEIGGDRVVQLEAKTLRRLVEMATCEKKKKKDKKKKKK